MKEKDINKAIDFVEKELEEWKEILKLYKNKSIYDVTVYETIHQVLSKEKPKKLECYADSYDEEGNLVYDMAVCPKCHREFEIDYDEHCDYCPSCGQKLDWSDIENEREDLN